MTRGQSQGEEEDASKKLRTEVVITFSDANIWGMQSLHDDVLVESLVIVNYDVCCILIDNKNSADILFYDAS